MKKQKLAKIVGAALAGAMLVFGTGLWLYAQTGEGPAAGGHQKILDKIQHQLQRKDTKLLCLDGCASDLDQTEDGKNRHWDNMQPGKPVVNDHGGGNCARAVISMMLSFYGKSLSQDRIAFYMEEQRLRAGDALPEGDLAHDKGMQYSEDDGGDETVALEWALNEKVLFIHGSPEFKDIKGWLDENRPIMIRRTNYLGMKDNFHISLIDAYRIKPDGEVEIRILDPLLRPEKSPKEGWRKYPIPVPMSSDKIQIIEGVWVGPVSAPNAREDERSIWTDSDGDGVMDFDEQNRFFTGIFDTDSDDDGVNDKNDIREYVFNAGNEYAKNDADLDKDGLRKELDSDNDNDLALDGCEDSNRNGRYEPTLGETSNFNPQQRMASCEALPIQNMSPAVKSGSMVYPTAAPVKNYNQPKAE